MSGKTIRFRSLERLGPQAALRHSTSRTSPPFNIHHDERALGCANDVGERDVAKETLSYEGQNSPVTWGSGKEAKGRTGPCTWQGKGFQTCRIGDSPALYGQSLIYSSSGICQGQNFFCWCCCWVSTRRNPRDLQQIPQTHYCKQSPQPCSPPAQSNSLRRRPHLPLYLGPRRVQFQCEPRCFWHRIVWARTVCASLLWPILPQSLTFRYNQNNPSWNKRKIHLVKLPVDTQHKRQDVQNLYANSAPALISKQK